jgi:hypothetical protein
VRESWLVKKNEGRKVVENTTDGLQDVNWHSLARDGKRMVVNCELMGSSSEAQAITSGCWMLLKQVIGLRLK